MDDAFAPMGFKDEMVKLQDLMLNLQKLYVKN